MWSKEEVNEAQVLPRTPVPVFTQSRVNHQEHKTTQTLGLTYPFGLTEPSWSTLLAEEFQKVRRTRHTFVV